MMSKDSVKRRFTGENGADGMSFTEFTYQLLQGYDFLYLNEHKNCKLQLGGADQWGNITTGTELIRKVTGNEAFALTCPLILTLTIATEDMMITAITITIASRVLNSLFIIFLQQISHYRFYIFDIRNIIG